MTTATRSRWQEIVEEKGLDVSIVDVKDLKRIDAEYYRPQFVNTEKFIEWHNFEILEKISEVKGGKRLPLGEIFSEEGVPYIRAEDIKNTFVDYKNSPKISLDLHKKLSRYQTKKGDVLITIVGNSIGDVGFVQFDLEKCNLTENAAKVVELKNINSEFLFSFFLSQYGQNQIAREQVGTSQPKLALVRIRNFKIPIPSNPFQNRISEIVQTAHHKQEQSKKLYSEAENILLEELGLKDWKPSEENISEKELAEVRLFGRMDAEFFQVKYDEIEKKIKGYVNGWDTLENLINVSEKFIKPKKEEKYQYCELADIDASLGIVSGYQTILGKDLPSRARMKIERNDVLVSSVAGSSAKVGIILDDSENLVASTGFFILKPKMLLPEVNLLLMKSFPYQLFLARSARGMILSATIKGDFKKFPVPKLDSSIQKTIAQKIQDSHTAREHSKTLLELAKRAVEIFVEQDEAEAEKTIQNANISLSLKK